MYGSYSVSDSDIGGALAGLGIGVWIVGSLIGLAVGIVILIAYFKIFKKAGVESWHAIIPFLNGYDLYDFVLGNGALFFINLIPGAAAVMNIIWSIKAAKTFGKDGGFAAGLIFLPYIFLPILGFGSATYCGPDGVPDERHPARDIDGNPIGAQGFGYEAPQQNYAPQQPYAAPQQAYAAPQQQPYGAPQQPAYAAPQQPYVAPAPIPTPAPAPAYDASADETVVAAAPAVFHGLEVINGVMGGCMVEMQPDKVYLVGKELPSVNVPLDRSYVSVSREHMQVVYNSAQDKYFVTDMSSNGTYMYVTQRLAKGAATPVLPGTELALGSQDCRVKLI
ncbi:MAG: DUF5684 domain-containing protein [Clostridia bacterium]|nr:DUF5684 domain-containing protein [Clostridia bacterium]